MVNVFNLKRARKEIASEAASINNPDIIIISIHNGYEFEHTPRSHIRKYYRSMIDAGADLILAHHPHVAQGVERYKHGLIFYSLGDFSFGPAHRRYKKKKAKMYGMLVRIKYTRKKEGRNSQSGNQSDNENKKHKHKLFTESVEIYPLYLDFWDPMIVNGIKYPPKRFVPRIAPNPFAKVILRSFIKWSHKIPGNNTKFKIKDNILLVQ